ncbi:MAG: glycoside hydrolase family 16 protein [Chloroflexota bacterium]|nr:MAG: glycoside hydrolase [Chloroflexota bacterium]
MAHLPPARDVPANPLEKPGYALEFHDEFDGPDIDPEKWLPFYLPHWSSRAQSAPRYTLQDSCLVLQITRDQQPWCPEFDGFVRCSSIQSGAFSGPVGSKLGQHRFNDRLTVREAQANVRKYTPQYGYFELRARGLATSANHVSLWMIGYEDVPEHSGEIAVFELLGSQRGPASSIVRYGVHPWGDPTLADEFYEERFDIDTAAFHIYGVEWTPEQVDFYLDNRRIRTIDQSPQYPMQFMLSIYELPFADAWTGPYNPDEPYPREFVIDYFRAYQPIGGY